MGLLQIIRDRLGGPGKAVTQPLDKPLQSNNKSVSVGETKSISPVCCETVEDFGVARNYLDLFIVPAIISDPPLPDEQKCGLHDLRQLFGIDTGIWEGFRANLPKALDMHAVSSIGPLDSGLPNRLRFTYADEIDLRKKTALILKELFNYRYSAFEKAFKENLSNIARKYFCYNLFLLIELQTNLRRLHKDEITSFVNILKTESESTLRQESELTVMARKLPEPGDMLTMSLIRGGQGQLIKALEAISKSKPKLTISDIEEPHILKVLGMIKRDPLLLKALERREELDNIGALVNPNYLSQLLDCVELSVAGLLSQPQAVRKDVLQEKEKAFNLDGINPKEKLSVDEMISIASERTLYLVGMEEQGMQGLINEIYNFRLRRQITFFGVLAAGIGSLGGIGLGVYKGIQHLNDIERKYNNTFLPDARNNMESLNYNEVLNLKDSSNPQRHIQLRNLKFQYRAGLNNKYFRYIYGFLAPRITGNITNTRLNNVTTEEIRTIREGLSNLVPEGEWVTTDPRNLQNMKLDRVIGGNFFAAGSPSSGVAVEFLVPHQRYYLAPNGPNNFQMVAPPDNEALSHWQSLRVQGANVPENPAEFQTRQLITGRHWILYTKTEEGINSVYEKVIQKKNELFEQYREESDTKELERILTVLKGIAILECRLIDLRENIQQRVDFIVENDTIWAAMER